MMIYPFALALGVGIAAWMASFAMRGRWPSTPGGLKLVVVTLLACYLAGLVLVCVDPYFEDNGVIEFIDWPDRWSWAGEFGGWIALAAVPIALLVRSFWPRR